MLGVGPGEHHYRQLVPARFFPNAQQYVAAVQMGELEIEQHEVGPRHALMRPFAPEKREGFDAVRHHPETVLYFGTPQPAPGQLHIGGIVFDEQDVDRGRAAHHGAQLRCAAGPGSRGAADSVRTPRPRLGATARRRSEASASAASGAVVTAQPRRASERAIASRIAGLSSTISTDHFFIGLVMSVLGGYFTT